MNHLFHVARSRFYTTVPTHLFPSLLHLVRSNYSGPRHAWPHFTISLLLTAARSLCPQSSLSFQGQLSRSLGSNEDYEAKRHSRDEWFTDRTLQPKPRIYYPLSTRCGKSSCCSLGKATINPVQSLAHKKSSVKNGRSGGRTKKICIYKAFLDWPLFLSWIPFITIQWTTLQNSFFLFS